jgi:hypothetical protein
MALSATERTRRVGLLIDAHARARTTIRAAVLAEIRRLWAALLNRYDDEQVAGYTAAVARAVAAGQQREANLVAAQLRRSLAVFDVSAPLVPVRLVDAPRGTDPQAVAERPVKDYRRLRLQGLEDLEAAERAERRALLVAETDLTIGMREGARQTLAPIDEVVGFRRIIRPELSEGGTCGLCIVASDRIYRAEHLMPIHDRCKCVVAPVLAGGRDPGRSLNREDLRRLYVDAGATAAAALKRTRYQLTEHGELGPVLNPAGQDPTGPRGAARRVVSAADIDVDAPSVLSSAERTIVELEARAAAGDQVAGPLAFQRELAERMRGRLASA